MFLRRLQLTNFRNYRSLDLALPAGNLVFVGDNAQGKSNLLEAVYLLAAARSARTSTDADLIGWQTEASFPDEDPPFTRLAASVERRAGAIQVEAVIAAAATAREGRMTRAGKRLRLNGVPRRGADFVGQLRAVLFTADDLSIISGAPSERRRFLDSMLSQLDRRYYASGQRYARVLQQRNAALKRIREGQAATEELDFWSSSLAAEGASIVKARLDACATLTPVAADYHRELSGESSESLEVAYSPRLGDEDELPLPRGCESEAIARVLSQSMQALRRREVAAGASLVGPHRDDVLVRLNGVSAASFASRAQTRTATLALRLGEARLFQQDLEDPPLLLLDDIVSELDEQRRRSVLAAIAGFDQVWFTATDTTVFSTEFLRGADVYRIAAGAFSHLNAG